MALIAMGSAKGAPGVSVTAAALSRLWHRRCIVADLDPLGSDVALRYRREDGAPLDTETGVLSLAATARRGTVVALDEHVQTTSGGMDVVVGFSSPAQVRGVGAAWSHVADSLRRVPSADVIADCGRISPGSPTISVIERADALVMAVRSTIEEVAHLRERLLGLQETLRIGHLDGIPVGVVTVADARDTQSAGDTIQLLRASGLTVASLGMVALDVKAAEAVRSESSRNIRRSVLMRSVADVAQRTGALLNDAHRRRELMV